jgi:hypothetical protein
VFNAIRDILSKEALLDAGDISIKKNKKRRRRVQKTDAVTGETVTEEVEEEVPEEEESPIRQAPAVPAEPLGGRIAEQSQNTTPPSPSLN